MNEYRNELSLYTVQFPPVSTSAVQDLLLKSIIIAGLGALVLVNVRAHTFTPILQSAAAHGFSAMLLRPSIIWFAMGSALFVFRTILWFAYRPHALATFESAPRMTVVIPAYNEGAMVAKSIDSVASANYHPDRLEIIVVDDGSTDDTWMHIQHAVARYGDRVQAFRLDRNRGKREALAVGFRQGKGEIFVTVDSDSVVDSNSLLALAGPFASERVGVVAGRVLVYNRRDGIIPRMLHVRFALSFDFLRAYQSTFGTVYCSPGALSAYRASAIRKVLDSWLQQSFLGVRATIGEDRALTNDIMRLGYDSVYQRAAMVLTVVPMTYNKLCRMFLRWDRSYIREELRFAAILWKRPPLARFIALLDSTITNLRFVATLLTLVLLGAALLNDPLVLPRLLVALGMASLIYSLYYLHSERSFDIVYGVLFSYFAFFSLFWIFPWALITVRARGWLTR
ncbi:MAG: glycosyltransferase [Terriglobales bacterium]